jgi:hypothetical protein
VASNSPFGSGDLSDTEIAAGFDNIGRLCEQFVLSRELLSHLGPSLHLGGEGGAVGRTM